MEPQVRYVRTEDGVNIAYYTMGEGEPFVILTLPTSHLLAERRAPVLKDLYDGIASAFKLVRLDPRGFGMSERNISDISLDHFVLDLETVLEKIEVGPVILFGYGAGSFIAATYAALHPEMVSRLILFHPVPRGSVLRTGRERAIHELSRHDWELGSETFSRIFVGRTGDHKLLAELMRESTSAQGFLALAEELTQWDLSEVLPTLSMPTLVLVDSSHPDIDVDAVRHAAALIPDCRLVELGDDYGELPRVTAQFFAETKLRRKVPLPSGTAIILFADIVDSTALTERLGDTAFRERARQLDDAMRKAIRDANGTTIEGKLVGDGVLAVFTSARDAITAAIACRDAARDVGLELHLGIHAGDVIRESGNVYGGAVNIAARISAASAPGDILVSDTVRALARTSAGVKFEDRGEHSLKGIPEPHRLFAVSN